MSTSAAGKSSTGGRPPYAALITALVTPFVYYAKTANLDVPYLFWFLASLYFYLRLRASGRARDYLLFALTAVFAVCTKDQAAALYGPAPLLMHLGDPAQRPPGRAEPDMAPDPLRPPTPSWPARAAVAAFLLVHNVLFNRSGFLSHLRLIFGAVWQGYQMVPAGPPGQWHLFVLTVRELAFCLTWPLLLVCAGGFVLALRERPRNPALLALPVFGLSYYVFYIATHPLQLRPVQPAALRAPVVLRREGPFERALAEAAGPAAEAFDRRSLCLRLSFAPYPSTC